MGKTRQWTTLGFWKTYYYWITAHSILKLSSCVASGWKHRTIEGMQLISKMTLGSYLWTSANYYLTWQTHLSFQVRPLKSFSLMSWKNICGRSSCGKKREQGGRWWTKQTLLSLPHRRELAYLPQQGCQFHWRWWILWGPLNYYWRTVYTYLPKLCHSRVAWT